MPGLDKIKIPVALDKGLDTKTDRKQVIPGRLLAVENGIYITLSSVRKRPGFASLETNIDSSAVFSSGHITQGAAAAIFKKELLEFSGTEVYSWSPSTRRWTDKSFATSFEVTVNPVIRNSYQQASPDVAVHSTGIQVAIWEDTRGGSRYSVYDSETNQFIQNDQLLASTASRPKAIAIGNYILLFYIDTSSHNLIYRAITVLTPAAIGDATTVATNVNVANPNYDVSLFSVRAFIAYNDSSGGGGIRVKYINNFLTVSSEIEVATEVASSAISIFVDSVRSEVYVAYYNGTKVKYFIRDYNLGSILGSTDIDTVANIRNIAGYSTNGNGQVWYEQSAGANQNYLTRTNTITRLGVIGLPSIFLRSVGLASKPFVYNGVVYLTVAYETTLQPTYFVVNSNRVIVGKFSPSLGGGHTQKSILPEVVDVGSGVFTLAALQKDLLTTISGQIYTLLGMITVSFDFESQNIFLNTELGNNIHVDGGFLAMYDGANYVEHGFHLYPDPVTIATDTAGGSIAAGIYSYVVCEEWTDNQGQIHRSAPSIPVSQTTTGATSKNTLTIPTLRLTAKTGVRLVVYRTQNAGVTYFQLNSIASPLLNDTNTDTVSYIDTVADASIVGNPILYTSGGVLENIAAPATKLLTTYKDRVMLVPSENPLQFWFSKSVIPGSPIEFNDSFVENVDSRGGEVTAHCQMDDKYILFKRTKVFYVVGNGPDNTGAQNDFTPAQEVNTDVGAISPFVVFTPIGVMFKTLKGIYLLDRSLGVKYVGAEVEAYNSYDIVSATLMAKVNQVRFCLTNGVCLVYDYFVDRWSTFNNYSAVSAVNFQDAFTFLNSSGIMNQEDPTIFTDNGNWIKLRVLTSWLSFAGLQGFQRVYRALILGEYFSPHKLLVRTAYDFNPSPLQEDYIDATSLLGSEKYGDETPYGGADGADVPFGGPDTLYEWRIDMARQKCTSIQLSIEDVQTEDFGEGLLLSALDFIVGAKKGSNKLPATRTFG